MKTLFLFLSGAVLATFLPAAYAQAQVIKKHSSSTVSGINRPSAVLQQRRKPCTAPCDGPMKWLTIPQALEMISEYGNNQYRGINTAMRAKQQSEGRAAAGPFSDARYIVFPMDTIKRFICKVEERLSSKPHRNADNQPIRPCDLGIKFYYAAYAHHVNAAGNKDSLTGRHTLFMIPTYWEEKEKAFLEFFPGYVDASGHPLPLKDLYDVSWPKPLTPAQEKMMMQFAMIFAADEDVSKNQGTLCPPPDACNAALLNMAVSLER